MAKIVQAKQNKGRNVYDPETSYRWDPDDIFEITGKQLATFFHLLHQEMNTIGGAPLSYKVRAHETVIELLKMGIEQGVIIPIEQEIEAEVKSLFNSKSTGSEANETQ
jgi:hypothetical protein